MLTTPFVADGWKKHTYMCTFYTTVTKYAKIFILSVSLGARCFARITLLVFILKTEH